MIRKAGPRLTQALENKVLVIVAGPSGSGKTVFINQFRSGTLAPELRLLLPDHSERWPQIGANDCMKRGVPLAAVLPKSWTADGGIVHYDTAYIHRFGLAGYDDDPSSDIFRRARRLIVISIVLSAGQLKDQFEARQAQHRHAKRKSHLFWRDHVRAPLERLFFRLKGLNPQATGDLYRNPAWLEGCYTEWDRFVGKAIAGIPGSRHVVLEPYAGPNQEPRFRIVPGITPASSRQPNVRGQNGA